MNMGLKAKTDQPKETHLGINASEPDHRDVGKETGTQQPSAGADRTFPQDHIGATCFYPTRKKAEDANSQTGTNRQRAEANGARTPELQATTDQATSWTNNDLKRQSQQLLSTAIREDKAQAQPNKCL